MKRRDGLTRCRYGGTHGILRWVGWGIVSNNLWVFMTADHPRRISIPSRRSLRPNYAK